MHASRSQLSEQEAPGRRRLRRAGAAVLVLLALGGLARCATIRGCWRPVRIAGGSMAEAFYGPHLAVTCSDCGFAFRCGIEYPPAQALAMCPHCGHPENPVDPTSVTPGQRVLIDRWPKFVRGVQAWQSVAFHTPADPDYWTVKRLVAQGPGHVQIRDGDIFVDDRIQRKSLAQLRALRMLVHDDRYRSPHGLRWQTRHAESSWRPTATGYEWVGTARADAPLDWLDYVQWTCWPHDAPHVARTDPVTILDHDGYNQSLSRGSLHPAADLMLACRLQLSDDATCVLRLTSRADTFDWELSAARTLCRLRRNGTVVAEARRPSRRSPWHAEFAVCDHRVLAALDGTTVFQWAYRPQTQKTDRSAKRLAVGAAGRSVHCDTPRVFRDVHYLGPGGTADWQAPQRMTRRQWFVLGDNVPVSVDSRLWSAIDDHTILGVVRPGPP